MFNLAICTKNAGMPLRNRSLALHQRNCMHKLCVHAMSERDIMFPAIHDELSRGVILSQRYEPASLPTRVLLSSQEQRAYSLRAHDTVRPLHPSATQSGLQAHVRAHLWYDLSTRLGDANPGLSIGFLLPQYIVHHHMPARTLLQTPKHPSHKVCPPGIMSSRLVPPKLLVHPCHLLPHHPHNVHRTLYSSYHSFIPS